MKKNFTVTNASHLRGLVQRYGLGDWSYDLQKQRFLKVIRGKKTYKTLDQMAKILQASIMEAKNRANEDEDWIFSKFTHLKSDDHWISWTISRAEVVHYLSVESELNISKAQIKAASDDFMEGLGYTRDNWKAVLLDILIKYVPDQLKDDGR